ncbi:hypothetical protein RCL1_002673 [Eukaryota sp. TZLM3-RCL]
MRYPLPPEHLRKIFQDHGDMSDRKFLADRRAYLGGLKFIPFAIFKLLESMPMPWEARRMVNVVYHLSGGLTVVNEIPRVIEPIFVAQWASSWVSMRREKRDRQNFRRMKFPPFDDEEPPLDYGRNILPLQVPSSIEFPLSIDTDSAVINFFNSHLPLSENLKFVNGPSYKTWKLPIEIMSNLFRLALPILNSNIDLNTNYLFNSASFLTAKALNYALPGGPKFDPLYPPDETHPSTMDEFSDVNKSIHRQGISTEVRVAFPHLYNSRPRSVATCPYHYPISLVKSINLEDLLPEFPAYSASFGTFSIPKVPPRKSTAASRKSTVLPPLMKDVPLNPLYGSSAFVLFNAPPPFNLKSSSTRRGIDVPLMKSWYTNRQLPGLSSAEKVAHQKLLKDNVKNELQRRKMEEKKSNGIAQKGSKRDVIGSFLKTKFFETTTIDWLEAGLQLCRQGHNMLNLLIHRKNLNYLHLDYNFTLKPVKTLTTKERKKSRFGHSFHLVRELLKFVKLVVDAHVQFRLGNVDAYQLADGLQYLFTHLGHLTGMYRYKYKLMHQVRICNDLKAISESKFNARPVGPGPGCGFWLPTWRTWVFFLSGLLPLMEEYLGNMLSRQFEGRAQVSSSKTVTKQRIESNYDLELRNSVLQDVMDIMPSGTAYQGVAKRIVAHLGEAWRCWKANLPWKVPGMPQPIEDLILRYVKQKSDWWTQSAHIIRERVKKGVAIDRVAAKKNLGRIARLYLKEEQNRQNLYLKEGPFLTIDQGISIYSTLVKWLESRNFSAIPFPPISYKHDNKLLILALEGLKEAYVVKTRLNRSQREELGLIEQAYEDPQTALARIKRHLLTQRTFREVQLDFFDLYTEIYPVYEVEPLEKITDAYLDQYLWYEAEKRGLFPNWIKPSDSEPPALLAHKWAQSINSLTDIWSFEEGEVAVHVELPLKKIAENIDLTLLNTLLKVIMNPSLADYITAKMNVVLTFKDMNVTNRLGLVKGLQFASFVFQFYSMVLDLALIGPSRATDIIGPPDLPNEFATWQDVDVETKHPLRLYCRHTTTSYLLFKFSAATARDLVSRYLSSHETSEQADVYPVKDTWPPAERMMLKKHDMTIGRAVFWQLKSRIPEALAELSWSDSTVSVYSSSNPALFFDMCQFDVRLVPVSRMSPDAVANRPESAWALQDPHTRERTALAFVRVSKDGMERFNNRVRQILITSTSTTFSKVINKWNTTLLGMVTYFREAIINTPELLDLLVKCENKVHTRVKMGLNSKMPARFPPVVFYSPKELGGLGMLSMGYILIPQADLRFSRQTESGITHFRTGLQHAEQQLIPNLLRYVTPWEAEIADSQRVWAGYALKRQEAAAEGRPLTIEDMEESWERGIPRISTLFQKDRHTLAYDKGWRVRAVFRQYQLMRINAFWWTNPRHDGRLWNLGNYRTDVIQALGGIDTILDHSLFKATGFTSYENLFWERTSGFEEAMKFKRLTNAQRSGLNQIPNRRFTLWWSPTINRADVYIGYQVQLDLTGIFMHGKIPTLKISLVQIFRAHLWQKIHESLVFDLCTVLDREMDRLEIQSVQKETIHPRKSYKMNSSTADITLDSTFRWSISKPSLLSSSDSFDLAHSSKFWIDVQLRWGNYDTHDIDRYARAKFLEYTTDSTSIYPSATGIVIAIDLAYNYYSAYGNWFPGLKPVIQQGMDRIMKADPALYVLRERIRTALQLYYAQPTQTYLNSANYGELFSNEIVWFADDSAVYRVTMKKSVQGSIISKPVNGAAFFFNPRIGQLYLKVMHTSLWAGQKRLGSVSRWKTAEECAGLIQSLSEVERPNSIVVTRKGLLDPLEVHLLDFPNISLKGCELVLPFSAFLKHPRLGNRVTSATEAQLVLYNVYDDWLEYLPAYTAFSRLILILRALLIDSDKAWNLLTSGTSTKPEHLWPTMSADSWITVEQKLKDMIITDFGLKNNVSVENLTQSEIRDVILGMEISAPTTVEEKIKKIDEERRLPSELTAVTTKTMTRHGDEVIVTTTSKYEQEIFKSRTDWRQRALASSLLSARLSSLFVTAPSMVAELPQYVIPENLIKNFVSICDVRSQVGGFVYGILDPSNPNTFQVRVIVIPFQYSDHQSITLPIGEPTHPSLENLVPLGWIHSVTYPLKGLSPLAGVLHSKLLSAHRSWGPQAGVFEVVLGAGSVTLSCYHLTSSGLDWSTPLIERDASYILNHAASSTSPWAVEHFVSGSISLTHSFKGFFLVPLESDGLWNLNFLVGRREALTSMSEFPVVCGIPLGFFDPRHRPTHFLGPAKSSSKFVKKDEVGTDFEFLLE